MSSELLLMVWGTVLPFLVSGAIALYRYLLSRIPPPRAAVIDEMVQMAVKSAEQQLRSAPGAEKKSLALQFLDAVLTARNIRLDPAEKEMRLEYAVSKLPKTGISGTSPYVIPDAPPPPPQDSDEAASPFIGR